MNRTMTAFFMLFLLLQNGCSDSGGGTSGTGVTDGATADSELSQIAPRATGVVTNAENVPIPDVLITNLETGEHVATGSSGQFILPIDSNVFCATATYGELVQEMCVDQSQSPELVQEIEINFVLEVPTTDIPVVTEPEPVLGEDEEPQEELRACGGLLGLSCEAGEFCNYAPEAICGAADAPGVCTLKPEACLTVVAPVCGCDGTTYSNECEANAVGISAAINGECPGE